MTNLPQKPLENQGQFVAVFNGDINQIKPLNQAVFLMIGFQLGFVEIAHFVQRVSSPYQSNPVSQNLGIYCYLWHNQQSLDIALVAYAVGCVSTHLDLGVS